ncbi:LapA family protein [Planococcus dechangensis]|uniref:Lipopolysaccharide assembly LapA domain-containing protein n=1 Tax=Planococcus dechangensis TaxID=1176255 RepID=A0ABV9M7W6_9BACL
MKVQWLLLLGLVFAIIIAIFAVLNVDNVPVNYGFGEAQWPLILVILVAALLGFLLSGIIAMTRTYHLNRKVKTLQKEVAVKESLIATQQNEIAEYQRAGVTPEAMVVTSEERTHDVDDSLRSQPRRNEFGTNDTPDQRPDTRRDEH